MFWIINISLLIFAFSLIITGENLKKDFLTCIGGIIGVFTVIIGFFVVGFNCISSYKWELAKSFDYIKTSKNLYIEYVLKDGSEYEKKINNIKMYNEINKDSKIYVLRRHNYYGIELPQQISIQDYKEK
ncbi:MAG: hypothetical protein RBR68_15240 [Tenuifilaceae bacterium]|nr:hypothetical protein [Tenuifilaceae bacterium]